MNGEQSVEGDIAMQAEAAAVFADVGGGGLLGEELAYGIEAGDDYENGGLVALIAPNWRKSWESDAA